MSNKLSERKNKNREWGTCKIKIKQKGERRKRREAGKAGRTRTTPTHTHTQTYHCNFLSTGCECVTWRTLDTKESANISGFHFGNFLHVVGVHAHQSRHLHLLLGVDVINRIGTVECALVHPHVGQLSVFAFFELECKTIFRNRNENGKGKGSAQWSNTRTHTQHKQQEIPTHTHTHTFIYPTKGFFVSDLRMICSSLLALSIAVLSFSMGLGR